MRSPDSFLAVSAHIPSLWLYCCNRVILYYKKYTASWPYCVTARVCNTATNCCWLCRIGGLVAWNIQTGMRLVEPLFEVPLPCLKSLDPRALVDRAFCTVLVKKSTFTESEHETKPWDGQLTCYSVGREHSQMAQFAVIRTSHQEAFLTNCWQLKRQKVNWRNEIILVREPAYLTSA